MASDPNSIVGTVLQGLALYIGALGLIATFLLVWKKYRRPRLQSQYHELEAADVWVGVLFFTPPKCMLTTNSQHSKAQSHNTCSKVVFQ
jgi:hypothetical protein